MIQRRTLLQWSTAAATVGVAGTSFAQRSTARIVVGFPPGAAGDIFARRLAEALKAAGYAEAAIVDNKPGGGGRLAIAAVKSAAPDGMTMVLQPGSLMTILPHAYKTRPYDPFRDFVAVGALGQLEMCLTVNPSVMPVENLAQYIRQVKNDPGKGKYGTGGVGSIPHLLGFRLAKVSGAKIEHVPYRGGPAAFQDLLAGQVPAMMGALQRNVTDAHQDGRLRILATSGKSRNPSTPSIPTFEESGFPMLSYADYNGIWVPAGTPDPLLQKLNAVLLKMNQDVEFLAQWSTIPLPLQQKDFAAKVKADYDANADLVKEIGFTADAS